MKKVGNQGWDYDRTKPGVASCGVQKKKNSHKIGDKRVSSEEYQALR